MINSVPTRRLVASVMPLTVISVSTVVSNFLAMALRVSAVLTVYSNGVGEGVKTARATQTLGLHMLKTRRMAINDAWGGHGIKDKSGFHAMLKKAAEIENDAIEAHSK